MKVYYYLTIVVLALLGTTRLEAQDIHFTMWDMAPLTVNPAYTGAYSGTARIGGIYRDQWRSFIPQFSTPSAFIDAPIIRGIKKNDWVGVGAMLFNDKAGSLGLTYGGFLFSGAYHLGLNKKGTTVLTLGVQGGSRQRNLSRKDDARFEDQIENGGQSVDFSKIVSDPSGKNGVNFTDFSGGLLFKTELNKTMDMSVGFSVGHITEPDYNLFNGTGGNFDARKRPRLTNLQGQFNIGLTEKLLLTPQFMYQATSGASEIEIQSWTGYQLNEKFKLRGGLGYRLGDAGQVLLGLDYKDLRVAAAYDINISDLSNVSKYQGGFELAAWYIIKIYKKPDVKPAILCPKL